MNRVNVESIYTLELQYVFMVMFFFLLYQYPVCMVSRYKKLILFERHLRGDDDPDDDAKQPQRASEDLDDENLDE